jgi:hypothetical protein
MRSRLFAHLLPSLETIHALVLPGSGRFLGAKRPWLCLRVGGPSSAPLKRLRPLNTMPSTMSSPVRPFRALVRRHPGPDEIDMVKEQTPARGAVMKANIVTLPIRMSFAKAKAQLNVS